MLPRPAVLALVGFALTSTAETHDLSALKARGVLRVLVAADETPETFSFVPGPSPGIERELIEGFARLERIEMKAIPVVRFEDMIPTLLRGEGDVILGINDTATRRKQIDFTTEVMPSRHVVVTRKPDLPITSLVALRAVRVGTVSGTSWAEAAAEAGVPASRIVELPAMTAVLDALKTKKVTAAVVSLADLTMAMRSDPALQAGLFLGPPGHAAWGVRKSDPELHQALDAYLENVRRTSWSRLVVKYFGEDALKVLGRARQE
jgi:ABC-type amino acid transport substrate-binding protein